MGNEYPLKTMVIGLHNLAADNEKLCDFLNLRARHKALKGGTFKGAEHKPPSPKYDSVEKSQAKAADLVTKIADNNARAVTLLKGAPSDPAPLDPGKYDDDALLRLMMDWGLLQSGVQKSMLRLYGQIPEPPAEHVSPGSASEKQLWCEIVAVLEKIAADSDLHYIVQDIEKGSTKPKAEMAKLKPLIRMELGIHRLTLDLLQLASRLPYHLHRAAHA